MKRCKRCGLEKPLSEFYREEGCRDGLRPECKDCNLAARKAWYEKNREREMARVRAWQKANPERHAATQKKVRQRRRSISRDDHLRRSFGISSDEYDAMLNEQGGVCRICGARPRENSSLHVDHDATSGRIRGLLCFRCNAALGQFRDDIELLTAAAEYLDGDLEPVSTRRLFRAIGVARARLLVGVSG